jgi:hypothetical protein
MVILKKGWWIKLFDELLKKYNLKYEDLNPLERETLNTWVSALEQGQLTLDKLRDYLRSMRDSVENDLTKTENNSKQDIFLKARLRNYMLLEAFLSTPEKARAAMDKALKGMIK